MRGSRVAPASQVQAGLIRDQSDVFAFKKRKILFLERIESCEYAGISIDFTMNSGSGQRFVIASDRYSRRFDSQRRRGNRGDPRAQRTDRRTPARMHAIGE